MIKNGKYTSAFLSVDNLDPSCLAQIDTFINNEAFTQPIAIMPDAHAGKSSCVGFTMPLKDKIIPNTIGVDIGCFTKETKVKLADNRELDFIQLIEEDRKGKENFCFSKDENNNIVIEKIINPRKTRTTNKLIRIILDNRQEIFCTPDHIFYGRDGKEILAENLIKNQSLLPLYIIKAKNIRKKPKFKCCNYKLAEYLVVYNPNTNLYEYIHVLADNYNIANNVYHSIPRSIRHHVDFNKYNNNPINITRMLWKEHWKIHSSHASENNKLGLSGWKKTWEKNRKRFSKMSSEKMKKLHMNIDFQNKIKKAGAENFKKYNKTEAFYKMTRQAGQRGKKYLIKYNKSQKSRMRSSKIGSSVNKRLYQCPKCNKIIKSARACPKHFKQKNHLQYNLVMKDMVLIKNHKIKSIELINCEQTDMYCFTTKQGNFALAAGVFVHNCGMLSINIGKDLNISLEELDKKIREKVPLGMNVHNKPVINMEREFPYGVCNMMAERFAREFKTKFGIDIVPPVYSYDWLLNKCKDIGAKPKYVNDSLGSLGGGNHFIEIGVSEKSGYWITIHTGSRNFGLKIAEYHQNKKSILNDNKERQMKIDAEIKAIKANYEKSFHGHLIADVFKKYPKIDKKKTGLEYLSEADMYEYLFDMIFAQFYASVNRTYIMEIILDILNLDGYDSIETVHNFIDFKDFIIRKGAIRSYAGERMIIPFNMRDGILICEGKSNPAWNYSAPHGAGRISSRAEARKTIVLSTFKKQMEGIYSTSVNESTIDEAPDAYKSAEFIENAISDTAIVIDRIKPIMNIKAGEE